MPKRWNVENSFLRKKVPNPQTMDDVRAISKSPTLCNQFQKFVIRWLLDVIEPKLDWRRRRRQGITLTCIDYAKVFNRQDHNTFLTNLHSMGVPGCS